MSETKELFRVADIFGEDVFNGPYKDFLVCPAPEVGPGFLCHCAFCEFAKNVTCCSNIVFVHIAFKATLELLVRCTIRWHA